MPSLWPLQILRPAVGVVMWIVASAAQTAPPERPATPPAAAPAVKPSSGVALVQQTLDSLARYDQKGRPSGQKIGFELPEGAVNEYLAYSLKQKPRPGIAGATVKFGGANEATLFADVDLSTVQEFNGQQVPEALRPMLRGKFAVKVTFQFTADNGQLRFTVKDAQGPNGVALPKPLVMEALKAVGLQQPEAIDTSAPVPLPFGLKRVWIDGLLLCGET